MEVIKNPQRDSWGIQSVERGRPQNQTYTKRGGL